MNYTDDVNGQIIGAHYGSAWVTYEGRKQGCTHYVQTEAEALEKCHAYIEEKKAQDVYNLIYPNKNGWKICIDNV